LGAKYALCNSESKDRFGSGNRNTNWSLDTFDKLRALIDSMEGDVCRDLFQNGSTTSGTPEVAEYPQDGVPGL
jgi:hypothetical protein